MTARVVRGLEELKVLAEGSGPEGLSLGATNPITVTQQMIQEFADATGDQQWIHTDVERARKESPFGTTVAHGYLTVALIPRFLPELIDVRNVSGVFNYGFEYGRFPAPLPAGSSLRMEARLKKAEDVNGGVRATYNVNFLAGSHPKPVCVATVLYQYMT